MPQTSLPPINIGLSNLRREEFGFRGLKQQNILKLPKESLRVTSNIPHSSRLAIESVVLFHLKSFRQETGKKLKRSKSREIDANSRKETSLFFASLLPPS